MLDKLSSIRSLSSKPLLIVILKLFGYCCKLSANRQRLLEPGLNTAGVMLRCLQLCLSAGTDSQQGCRFYMKMKLLLNLSISTFIFFTP